MTFPHLAWLYVLPGVALACAIGSASANERNGDSGLPATAGERRAYYIEFSDEQRWSLQTQGDYHCRFDRRNLYCMYHLCTAAAAGDHATLFTTATIPHDWQPPYGLEFYGSDDYVVQPSEFTHEGWAAVHAYPGHRFKQVLVNGQVVWEADVGDVGSCLLYTSDAAYE